MILLGYSGKKWVEYMGAVEVQDIQRGIPVGDPAAVALMAVYTWPLVMRATNSFNSLLRG